MTPDALAGTLTWMRTTLRTNLAACLLVGLVSVPLVAGTAGAQSDTFRSEAFVALPRARMDAQVDVERVIRIPHRIESDGSKDVTKELGRFIHNVPDGSMIVFRQHGLYRIEGTVVIRHRNNLVFAGNGARLKATTWKGTSRTRAQLRFVGGSNLVVRDLTVVGANPYAGTSERAYNGLYEAQHAFDILGVQGMLLEHVRAFDTWGDFVYIGPEYVGTEVDGSFVPSRNVTVRDSTFSRNGRMGIAIISGEDVLIENNHLTRMRRSVFDIEPTADSWQVHRVSIVGNRTGAHRLAWIANAGAGGDNVSDIYVAHNVARFANLAAKNWATSPRSNYLIEYNEFTVKGSPGSPFSFETLRGDGGFENIVIRYNTLSFPEAREMTAVSLIDAHNVEVYGNAFTGAAAVLLADAQSTGYTEWDNTT
jgi:Right handed beta helix region